MIPVVTFAAWSGTGKTTYLEKLVAELKRRGLRVAVLKHDAHEFEVDKPGKDSWRFTRAGADVTIVASATHAAILENRPVSAEELVQRVTGVDLILTEGYKYGPWPKVGVCRAATEKGLPLPAEDCLALVTDVPLSAAVPQFPLDDPAPMAEFLISRVLK